MISKLSGIVAILAGVALCSTAGADAPAAASERVVLLHGLARSADSMKRMARELEHAGYRVCNIDYPSREHSIEVLTSDYVAPAIRACVRDPNQPVHFVTHSLGGIVVRKLAESDKNIRIGRVVMLSPPNGGSEVVDKLGDQRLFELLNGPAGKQLGTGDGSVPRALGPATFELGVVTGRRSINLFLSMLIPGTDDGKVSIENAKLAGMKDFVIVAASHPFIMRDRAAIEHTLHFLATGAFVHEKGG